MDRRGRLGWKVLIGTQLGPWRQEFAPFPRSARQRASFPNSVWERMSAKLCFAWRTETEFQEELVPKQSLGTETIYEFDNQKSRGLRP